MYMPGAPAPRSHPTIRVLDDFASSRDLDVSYDAGAPVPALNGMPELNVIL